VCCPPVHTWTVHKTNSRRPRWARCFLRAGSQACPAAARRPGTSIHEGTPTAAPAPDLAASAASRHSPHRSGRPSWCGDEALARAVVHSRLALCCCCDASQTVAACGPMADAPMASTRPRLADPGPPSADNKGSRAPLHQSPLLATRTSPINLDAGASPHAAPRRRQLHIAALISLPAPRLRIGCRRQIADPAALARPRDRWTARGRVNGPLRVPRVDSPCIVYPPPCLQIGTSSASRSTMTRPDLPLCTRHTRSFSRRGPVFTRFVSTIIDSPHPPWPPFADVRPTHPLRPSSQLHVSSPPYR
jgi:hypothetical protein